MPKASAIAATSSCIENRDVGSVNVRRCARPRRAGAAAWIRFDTTFGSDDAQVVACADIGHTKHWPAASARMMSLRKADSWPVRAGGRASTPGIRSERPSTQPRRLKSSTRISPISFCAP